MPENEAPKKKLTGALNPFKASQRRTLSFTWMARSITAIFLLLMVYFIAMIVLQRSWQAIILTGVYLLLSTVAIWIQTRKSDAESLNEVVIFSILAEIGLAVLSPFVKSIWVPIAIISLVFTFIISSIITQYSNTSRWSNFIFPIGLVISVGIAVIGINVLTAQLSFPYLLVVFYVLLALVVGLYLFLLFSNRVQAGLRIKLTSIFLAITLIPLILITVIQSVFLQNAIQNQANTALRLAAEHVGSTIDAFVKTNLDSVAQQSSLSVLSNFINVYSTGKSEGSPEKQELVNTIQTLRSGLVPYTPSYAIFDADGKNIYDTNPQQINSVETNADYFVQAKLTGKAYASTVEFASTTNNPYLYFSAPILNAQNQFIGVLRIRYDALILQKTLQDYVGLVGPSTFPVLLDDNNIRLADTITPNLIYKAVSTLSGSVASTLVKANKLPSNTTNYATNIPAYAAALKNYATAPSFALDVHPEQTTNLQVGYIIRLTTQSWKVVYLQNQSAILAIRDQQLRVSTLIATAIAAVAGIIGTIVSILISNPISSLTSTAEKIATGDLQAQAVIKSRDEIETLATAFNLMTSQLRGFIGELENRVNERTRQLADQNQTLVFRGRQLQTVSDVARGITQTQDLETLLSRIVTLISQRFGFYHVGVFLVDADKNYAVLRASNSEGGQRMLARHHQLKVGQVGIVGYVTAQGKPRTATDVGQDAVYFSNPDLPETKSEMALPLAVGDNIIGALDVQSKQSNAFTEQDLELFSTLADQVAIAIYNNELFAETSKALEEAQKVHRQYLEQQWSREAATRAAQGFQYTPEGIRPISDEEQPEVREALLKGEPVQLDNPQGSGAPVLAVPIRVRGETIGVIHLEESSGSRLGWSPDEIETIKNVSDQIGLALENARLFEQTVRRAERERKVLEITSKIRSTTDPKAMMDIARTELQRALHAEKNTKPQTGTP